MATATTEVTPTTNPPATERTAAAVTLIDPYSGERLAIPSLASLEEYLTWIVSDAGPKRGKFTYLAGELECDLAPQMLFSHGDPAAEIARVIGNIVHDRDLGYVTTHESTIALPEADAGVAPDVMFVSHASLASDRITLRDGKNKPTDDPNQVFALVGPPDLVVEVVSKSSVRKDTVRLREAYEKGGVTEYWLVDAREEAISFDLLRLIGGVYSAVKPDGDRFRRSEVFGRSFRLTRRPTASGFGRVVCEDRA